MEFFNSKKFILLIALVLFMTAISGCAKKTLETKGPRQPTTLETVGKMKGIVSVLGCMFAPGSEECQSGKGKDTGSEEDKEWEKFDEEK